MLNGVQGMKLIGSLAAALLLCACSLTKEPYLTDPAHYGLYVASTWLYAQVPVTVQDADSGKTYAIQIDRIRNQKLTYLVSSLPPGHYYLYSVSSYGGSPTPLKSGETYFEVQAGCFNYGGHIDLQSLDDLQPDLYSDQVAQAIQAMPQDLRDEAKGHDVCISALGHASVRIPAAQAAELFGPDAAP
jgi:hypothetical protein